ncbi:lytic murein transglycosylase [Herbiconiux sp. KACC 21604]|uniref:lytic transglycosylase domain-containing protein n=1 Tax=unclassified Herbiconiux TaxID=2618217 RepID=UPI0014910BBB|nr:lytic murein transglycosylase [Herbiconiux sp. SALV-R1]QJU53204.1 murein transglycosylase [Herbiconiux sp. SALV-R1]WPO88153.1 lytic murein transglycosylase [Herbiconiux sp. KACC 21604]
MTARIALGALVTGMLALLVWLGLGAVGAMGSHVVAAEGVPLVVLHDPATGAAAGTEAGAGSASGAAGAPAVPLPASVQGEGAGAGESLAVASVSAEWAAQTAQATGVPVRALTAYAAASLRLAAEQPACGLGWNTLAALGWIESGHGTHGGSALGADGRATPGIYGPSLDGGDYAAIPDSDGGALDGDARTDRAVGPLQFIPQTWASWGVDADGDGVADPQQIDDAALTAGRYLCHYGTLTDPAAWRSAVFAYNHLDSYVDAVAAQANEYAARASGVQTSSDR